MNFLSHYYFYKTDDSYYNTGLVLPDLVKSFCRTHLKPLASYTKPSFVSLGKGSIQHLEADKRFHNSAFFTSINRSIAAQLNKTGAWPRKWFLNHLLCEILIDRVLMERNQDLCGEFYRNLTRTDVQQVALFLKLSGVHNPQNFATGYERFVKIQFISEYIHNENIILALDRVYSRLGIVYEWKTSDKSLLAEHIPHFLTLIDNQLESLKLELR